MYRDEQYKPLIGRKVVAVSGSTLYLDNWTAFEFDLDGDCYSTSEYTSEGLAAFKELLGATIREIEDRGDAARAQQMIEKWGVAEEDSWHFLVFTTDKGHVTVDWRNISNGYYDGSVVVRTASPLPGPAHDAALEGNPSGALALRDTVRTAALRPKAKR